MPSSSTATRACALLLACCAACREPRQRAELCPLIENPPAAPAESPPGTLVFGGWLEVEPDPRAKKALVEAFRLERREGREKALRALNAAIEEHPQCAPLFAARGALHVATGFPRASTRDFEHALDLAPDCAMTWFALGYAYELLKLSRQALAAFERAHELGCEEPRLLLSLARARGEVSGPAEDRGGRRWLLGTSAPDAGEPVPASATSSAASPR